MILLFKSLNVVNYINGFHNIELTLNSFNPIWSWYIIFIIKIIINFIIRFCLWKYLTFPLIFISDIGLIFPVFNRFRYHYYTYFVKRMLLKSLWSFRTTNLWRFGRIPLWSHQDLMLFWGSSLITYSISSKEIFPSLLGHFGKLYPSRILSISTKF